MEQMYEWAKEHDNKSILKIEYNEEEIDSSEVQSNPYFQEVERKGTEIEFKLLSNFNVVQDAISKRENEIFSLAPILNLQLKTLENKSDRLISQRKIWETINLRKHEKKTQEIKIDEDEDFDEELELFHSRFQNSYLVVDKTFPTNIPKDDDSEKSVYNENSEFSPSQRSKILDNKLNEVEVPMLTPEVIKSNLNANLKEAKFEEIKAVNPLQYISEFIPIWKIPDANFTQEVSKMNNDERSKQSSQDDSSLSSSSNDPVDKDSSVSSKPQKTHLSNPSLSKTVSEKKNMAHWVEEEKEEFKKQLQVHGKNWKKIATIIKNKTEKQIRNFYQNYKKKLWLEELLPKTDRGRGKKTEGSHSGLKRVRSFNKSSSPVKLGNKRKKVSSSSNSSDSSLSDINEEDSKDKSKNSSSNSDSSESVKKPIRKKQKNVVRDSSSEENSSSSSSNEDSVESSLSSKHSKVKGKLIQKEKKRSHSYESGESLD